MYFTGVLFLFSFSNTSVSSDDFKKMFFRGVTYFSVDNVKYKKSNNPQQSHKERYLVKCVFFNANCTEGYMKAHFQLNKRKRQNCETNAAPNREINIKR